MSEKSFGGIEVTQVWFDEMISWEEQMKEGTIGHIDNGKTGLASAVAKMLAAEEKRDPNLTVPVPDYPPGTPKDKIREIDPDPKPKKKGK